MDFIHTNTLSLDDTQLYELTHAIQGEYVKLHKHIAENPYGTNQAVIGRARESRKALGQVFDQIMSIKPEWADSAIKTAFLAARSQADSEWS